MAKTSLDKEKSWDLKIALYAALIGGAISLVSSFATQFYASAQKRNDDRVALLNKRIDLVDKTAKTFYQLPGVQEMFSYSMTKGFDTVRINPVDMQPEIVPKDYLLSKELSQIRADYFAVLIQDQLYFGDSTRRFLNKMQAKNDSLKIPWWKTPEDDYKKLLETMTSELQSR